MPKFLVQSSDPGVSILTLNRPEVGNACDSETIALFADALSRADADPSVRVVVLRGAGPVFCSGLDISAVPASSGPMGQLNFSDLCHRLDGISKPTIAIVHGACVGGGVSLAACCDVVLAGESAFFSLPEVRVGLSPGPLVLYAIRGLGVRSLRRYLLSGERFDATTALRLGLVHAVHPTTQLGAALDDLIEALLLAAPAAQTRAKAILAKHHVSHATDAELQTLQSAFEAQMTGEEAREGRSSFREKRKPNWSMGPSSSSRSHKSSLS